MRVLRVQYEKLDPAHKARVSLRKVWLPTE